MVRSGLHDILMHSQLSPLTVIVAPAAWGKATLLSQWAHDPVEARGIAWVSLDASDDEPIRFWTYVLTALGEHGVGRDALEAQGAPGLEQIDVALHGASRSAELVDLDRS